MTTPPFNPRVRAVLYEVLDNQLRDNDPPETKETLDRLVGQGIERDEARRLITCVIADEVFMILKENATFDTKRFARKLSMLPEMPWTDE
jgi:hypothetical protein